MPKRLHFHLSRCESQIMDIVYRLGEANAEEVRKHMPDSASYNSVRVTLSILEQKGYVAHRLDGNRHVYRPTTPIDTAKRSALRHVLSTFFGGSAPKAVSTLLRMSASELSEDELNELAQLIEEARKERLK